jgi:malonyl-CoA O-methyltransferase
VELIFQKSLSKYQGYSSVEKSAAEVLLKLLKIGSTDNVLDLGCGIGNLTKMIREITKGKIVEVDPSEGMIGEAIEKSMGLDITFEVKSAEEIEYKSCFDVIFCNSSLQWFREPQKAVKNCYIAPRKGGRN